ncbi:MAG: hypothetical protein Fur0032_05820 [Terrimicrobiaceae bacterium]
MKNLLTITVSVLLALPAGASLITYDGFDYAASTNLDGLNGGSGWQNGWQNQNSGFPTLSNITVQSPGLSSGSLVVSGNQTTANTFDSTGRRLDVSFGGAWDTAGYVSDPFLITQIDQGNVWGSFLARRNSATASWDGGPAFSLHRNNTDWFKDSNTSLQVLWDSSASIWTANVNGGTSQNLSATGLGDTALFVFKLELSTSGTNNIYLWLNPSSLGGADLATGTADASFTGLASADARFKAFAFYGGGSVSNATTLDEVRFGTDYASVTPIPEPGSLALVAVALLSAVLMRRSRAA